MTQRSTPLYQEIADELLAEIRSGKFAVGAMMPTEMELRERFGVSRHTIREAIRQLDEMGFLTRQAGLGTMIKASEANGTYTQSIDHSNDFAMILHIHEKDDLPLKPPTYLAHTDMVSTPPGDPK